MPEETSNVTYIDNDTMNIVFSALIINVESVNRKYGTLNDFLNQYALPGETNGKLFMTSEINKPPYANDRSATNSGR